MQPTYNPNGLLVCDEDELLASSGGSKTDARQRRTSLELWGGVECTVNRVGDRYQDQLELNGHALREPDLDLFAGLGIRAIRYPVIWERTMPGEPDAADWSWPDRRLRRLQRLGIRPIVGLIHHGSGPRHTSLVDPDFPEKLAAYAGAVAARYPWLDAYTPVNEPLTTARFSGLYGHWYPHGRDPHTFARTLIHQCRAVALSMRAIRRVNPLAQLVQTDDLGKTFSTPGLAYQAEFENERRWVTWDLLCGKVDSEHPMWNHLLWSSVEQRELEWFLENPCPPDILGLNYYMTSERFLDERYELYPESVRGGNGRHIYADVEAVRVCTEGPSGAEAILEEAWERYHLPIAVTEAHLGCTREEQLRWLLEVWNGARAVQGRGADIRAVTIWSLLGAFDWNSLLTRPDRHYEPGVYDLRGGWPRPTALAGLARELAEGQEPQHPVLSVPGWWRQPSRLVYPCQSRLAVVDADGDKGPEVAACPRSAPVRGLGQETPPRPLVI
ncbi:MAG TPA: family 1 glycosylhydrolase, partial [Armatimonadota bacterium]|nr:family 1 glycosylhydrolase [Armatimonadota bacterium]